MTLSPIAYSLDEDLLNEVDTDEPHKETLVEDFIRQADSPHCAGNALSGIRHGTLDEPPFIQYVLVFRSLLMD